MVIISQKQHMDDCCYIIPCKSILYLEDRKLENYTINAVLTDGRKIKLGNYDNLNNKNQKLNELILIINKSENESIEIVEFYM